MSAGEKRRILIARALVHRPRQLLLDEPSNALDLAAQRELRETLRRLAGEGTGVVLVTHHLGDILPEIKRVILMSGGRIVGDGPKAELLTAATAALRPKTASAAFIAAKRSGCTAGNGRGRRAKAGFFFGPSRTESGNETKVTKMRLDALGPLD